MINNDIINEVKMSPSSLSAMTSSINAVVGVEFELYVPDVYYPDSPADREDDLSKDEPATTIEEVIKFFSQNNVNTKTTLEQLENKLSRRYSDWFTEKLQEDWRSYLENIDDPDESQDAFDDYETEYYSNNYERDMEEWFESNEMSMMSDISNNFAVRWPFMMDDHNASLTELQYEFEDVVYKEVKVGQEYHSVTRDGTSYIIEPDPSLSHDDGYGGTEIVSPPLKMIEMIHDMKNIIKWAKAKKCYTDSDCGLHINVSIEGVDNSKLDYVKLALFVGENYILDQFDRSSNTFARKVIPQITTAITNNSKDVNDVINDMSKNLSNIAHKVIHKGITVHHDGINVHDNYIEFRYAGDNWLDMDFNHLVVFMMRYVVAYDIACDPTKYQQEYATKLYKLFDEHHTNKVTRTWVNMIAGITPNITTRQSVINKQISDRNVKQWKVTFNKNARDIDPTRKKEFEPPNFDPFAGKEDTSIIVPGLTADMALKNARVKLYMTNKSIYPSFYFKVREVK